MMEFIRELLPFFLSMMVIPPLVLLAFPKKWSGRLTFVAVLFISVVVGLVGSTIVSEQFGSLADRIVALIIDSSTAYAGSQIAYWLFWKPVLEPRLRRRIES
jgi:hypothetical protein